MGIWLLPLNSFLKKGATGVELAQRDGRLSGGLLLVRVAEAALGVLSGGLRAGVFCNLWNDVEHGFRVVRYILNFNL